METKDKGQCEFHKQLAVLNDVEIPVAPSGSAERRPAPTPPVLTCREDISKSQFNNSQYQERVIL